MTTTIIYTLLFIVLKRMQKLYTTKCSFHAACININYMKFYENQKKMKKKIELSAICIMWL